MNKSTKRHADLVDKIVDEFVRSKNENADLLNARITTVINNFFGLHSSPEDRESTVLLSDIRGFTSLSEQYKAGDIIRMLNHYFTEMNKIIFEYGGRIDKYIGDAIMVLFGIGDEPRNSSQRAVACAVEMQIAMDKVNAQNKQLGLPELFMGIGINTGPVSAGAVGSDLYKEFTVIGDGVNLASRVESHSLRGQILISEYTYQNVRNTVEVGAVNKVRVKGKKEFVTLYEITACRWTKNLTVPRREIRTSARVSIDSRFSFQLIKDKRVLPEAYIGHAKDISYQGLYASVKAPFEVLSDIKLTLALSIIGGDLRDVYGKIVSIRKTGSEYGCGIEFTYIDEESKQAIKDFIDRIIEA